jgi:hypothetical protein
MEISRLFPRCPVRSCANVFSAGKVCPARQSKKPSPRNKVLPAACPEKTRRDNARSENARPESAKRPQATRLDPGPGVIHRTMNNDQARRLFLTEREIITGKSLRNFLLSCHHVRTSLPEVARMKFLSDYRDEWNLV